MRRSRVSNIPPLGEGTTWHTEANSKAELLARTWNSKNVLPPMPEDQFVPQPSQRMQEFVAIRTRSVHRALTNWMKT